MIRRLPGRRPRWGNLRRDEPFSACYGWDRGLPVDRFYIERFLSRMSPVIRGDVLEVRDSEYTHRFAKGHARAHVIDIDRENRRATIIGDICSGSTLAGHHFDCILLTQILQYLLDPCAALHNAYRSLRPGGVLLVTTPSVARMDQRDPDADYWRLTPNGLRKLLRDSCPEAQIDVFGAGNLVTALAALMGCAVEDLTAPDMAADHRAFPILACAAVTKPGPPS